MSQSQQHPSPNEMYEFSNNIPTQNDYRNEEKVQIASKVNLANNFNNKNYGPRDSNTNYISGSQNIDRSEIVQTNYIKSSYADQQYIDNNIEHDIIDQNRYYPTNSRSNMIISEKIKNEKSVTFNTSLVNDSHRMNKSNNNTSLGSLPAQVHYREADINQYDKHAVSYGSNSMNRNTPQFNSDYNTYKR